MNFIELPDDMLNLILLSPELTFTDVINLRKTCTKMNKLGEQMEANNYLFEKFLQIHRKIVIKNDDIYTTLDTNSGQILYDGPRSYTDSKQQLIIANYSRNKLQGSYRVYGRDIYLALSTLTTSRKPKIIGSYEQGLKKGLWAYEHFPYVHVYNYDKDPETCYIYFDPQLSFTNNSDQEENKNIPYELSAILSSKSRLEAVGKLINNKREGIWKLYDYKGELDYIGNYINNLKEGLWKRYLDEEIIQEVNFKAGLREGQACYYSNGCLKSKYTYEHDKLNGKSIKYHSNLSISYISLFKNNNLEGPEFSFYDDGTPQYDGYFHNNLREGKWRFYHYYPRAKIAKEGYYFRDHKVGHWNIYYPSGVLRGYGNYRNGRRIGDWRMYDKDGNLRKIVQYIN